MRRYLSLILASALLLGMVIRTPQTVLAHDADGKYYNKDIINGLDNYRDVKLYWDKKGVAGKEIKKPISSMTVTTNGKYYKDNGSETEVSATIEVGTPIEIDFSDSQKISVYDIAEIGLQITNGTGEKMDWSSLPNGKEDTAYASQYPFSWGKASFTPKKPGTYKIYGEVRADIDKSQILYNWDAWSHNGSHSEYANILAHSSPPAGEIKAYPVKWYFEVVAIKVVDKIELSQGLLAVKYIDSETGKEIADPVILNNIAVGTHKTITASGIEGYVPSKYKKWTGTEDLAAKQTEEKYANNLSVDITKSQNNWYVYLLYDKVQPVVSNGGELAVSIIKIDGLDKFGYDPQWSAELYRGYEELGYTYGTVFDMALMDRGCYPDIPWSLQVNFDNLKTRVEKARKYKGEVSYKWKQTYHEEWQIIGSHEEAYTDSKGKTYSMTVDDFGWVTITDPPPIANVMLDTSTSGRVTTQISYNIANGEDATIDTQQISSNASVSFQLEAGETKSFEFSMPLYSQMYPNMYSYFQDSDSGIATISVAANATVPTKVCTSCGTIITYNQPNTATSSKNISIKPAKVFDHYMHLGE